MTTKLKWGILGTGTIANTFAKSLLQSQTGILRAVGSRTAASAEKFSSQYSGVTAYGSYDELLADPHIDAIYISLPNHLHYEWTIRCAEAAKHILCEKPMATNFAEAMAMLEAVRRADVFFMEAFMYRCHPQTLKLISLVREGAIGKVRLIQAHFAYNMGEDFDHIVMKNEAAGGSLLDVGCYCTSMSRLIAGASNGHDFAEPIELKAVGHIGSHSRVDEWTTAVAKFPGDVLANLSCGSQVEVDSTLRVWGDSGNIQVPEPWLAGSDGSAGKILLQRAGQELEEIEVPSDVPLYALEADAVAEHIANRHTPFMTWEDSIGNQKMLDAWRKEINLVFDYEKPEGLKLS